MLLFVKLAGAQQVGEGLPARIGARLRAENSPRHVPDRVLAVPAIPYTATGKRMEVPVRRLLEGADPAQVGDRNAVADPAALDWFVAFAQEFRLPGGAARLATVA